MADILGLNGEKLNKPDATKTVPDFLRDLANDVESGKYPVETFVIVLRMPHPQNKAAVGYPLFSPPGMSPAEALFMLEHGKLSALRG